MNSARQLRFRDSAIYISSPADSILEFIADGYVRVGTASTSHGLAGSGDFLVSGDMEVDGDIFADADIEIASAQALYFGDQATNGTWRIQRSGDDLVIERREGGSWVTKATIED